MTKIDAGLSKLEDVFRVMSPAIQLGGVAATDPRFARRAYEAGVRVLEPNHTAITCVKARGGSTTTREAYERKHELDYKSVYEIVRSIRRAIPPNVFIIAGLPGSFDEVQPRLTQAEIELLSDAGADGLFVEKNDYGETERLVDLAHKHGLLVQAAFQLQSDGSNTAVIPVKNPEGAGSAAGRLVDMGVDVVGMRFSGIFKSLDAGSIPSAELECLESLVAEVDGPTVVYAGVNAQNLPEIARTGVKMVGLASAVDDQLFEALDQAIDGLTPMTI